MGEQFVVCGAKNNQLRKEISVFNSYNFLENECKRNLSELLINNFFLSYLCLAINLHLLKFTQIQTDTCKEILLQGIIN